MSHVFDKSRASKLPELLLNRKQIPIANFKIIFFEYINTVTDSPIYANRYRKWIRSQCFIVNLTLFINLSKNEFTVYVFIKDSWEISRSSVKSVKISSISWSRVSRKLYIDDQRSKENKSKSAAVHPSVAWTYTCRRFLRGSAVASCVKRDCVSNTRRLLPVSTSFEQRMSNGTRPTDER